MSNLTTTSNILSIPWVLEPGDAELVNEARTGERSSDGRWMKQNVKLNTPVVAFSEAKVALAAKFDEDAEFLFAARR